MACIYGRKNSMASIHSHPAEKTTFPYSANSQVNSNSSTLPKSIPEQPAGIVHTNLVPVVEKIYDIGNGEMITVIDKTGGRIRISQSGIWCHGNIYLDECTLREPYKVHDKDLLENYCLQDLYSSSIEKIVFEIEEGNNNPNSNVKVTEFHRHFSYKKYIFLMSGSKSGLVDSLEECPVHKEIAIAQVNDFLIRRPSFKPEFIVFCSKIGTIVLLGKNRKNQQRCYIAGRYAFKKPPYPLLADRRARTDSFHVIEEASRKFYEHSLNLVANPQSSISSNPLPLHVDFPDPRRYTIFLSLSPLTINGLSAELIDPKIQK